MNKIDILSYAMRHPDTPAPVKQFPLGLRDMSFDGVERYDIVISVADLARLPVDKQLQLSVWILESLLPQLRQYANITVSKFVEELNSTDGDESFG